MREGKYQPLQDYLADMKADRWEATFEAVEKILGFTLPGSARNFAEWWANEDPKVTMHSHCKSWVLAGWKTENVDLTGHKVTFVKEK